MVLMDTIAYDTDKYNFRGLMENMLEIKDLENIHKLVNYECFTLDNDQSSTYHKKFYDKCEENPAFDNLYKLFVKEYICEYLNDKELIFQRRPTFRVHYNENLAVGEFHRDFHYGHPKSEINFFTPVTDCWATNTIWIESQDGKKDFNPVELQYGQIFVFNGGILTHGNKINKTGKSRVSFDFRCIRGENILDLENLGTSNKTNKRFAIGDYYERV